MEQVKKDNTPIIALVLGILSLTLCYGTFGFIVAIVGLVMANKAIKKLEGDKVPGMLKAAKIISILGIVFNCLIGLTYAIMGLFFGGFGMFMGMLGM
tara:strand:+ start:187 stop:477 length:291 start_codon:yes stop_codon:yes gene_type:complete